MKCFVDRYASALLVALLTGCASTPPMAYSYFPAKASTNFTVTQTLTCNADKTAVIITSTPSISNTYSSNRAKAIVFDANALQGWFADSDLTFAWYDDGRLKSINQSSTGQGEAVVKSVMTLAAAAGAGGSGPKGVAKPLAIPACQTIDERGSDKGLVIVYTLPIDDTSKQGTTPTALVAGPAYTDTVKQLNVNGVKWPRLQAQVQVDAADAPSMKANADFSSGFASLELRATAHAKVSILLDGAAIATSDLTVPTDQSYTLPILKPAKFGKQTFSLTLNEAGVITQAGYGKSSGSASALNAAGNIQSTLSPSDSSKASDLKAQSDVIAQTARLARCQTDPAKCQ